MRAELTFGQRLRQIRIRAGLSQSELETASGIPKARLSRYENGHVAPSIHTLARLAEALQVSEATLLGDQRALLETFFSVLYDRGVRIYSIEQATRLAEAIAELIGSVSTEGAEPPSTEAPEPLVLEPSTASTTSSSREDQVIRVPTPEPALLAVDHTSPVE
jgi:transcriptional regulator with XRE-family HTH domain